MMMVVVLNRTEYRECRLTLDQSVQPPAPPSVVAQHHHHHQDMVAAHHHQWWYRCFSTQTVVSGHVCMNVEGKRNKITNITKIIMVTPMYSNSPRRRLSTSHHHEMQFPNISEMSPKMNMKVINLWNWIPDDLNGNNMVLKYHFEGQTVSMARLHPS